MAAIVRSDVAKAPKKADQLTQCDLAHKGYSLGCVTSSRDASYSRDSLFPLPICGGIPVPNIRSGYIGEVPHAATTDKHTNNRDSNGDADRDGDDDGYHADACDTFDDLFVRSAETPLPEAPGQMPLDCL